MFDNSQSLAIKKYEKSRGPAQADAELQSLMDEIPDIEPETPAPREPVDEGESFASNVAGAFGSVGHGIIKAGQEVGNLALSASNGINQWLIDNDMEALAGRTDREINFADNPEYVYQPEGTAENLISGISNFLAPMGAASKAAKGVKAASTMGKFAKAGALGAAVDFAAFDPHEARLSDFVEQHPQFSNPLTSFLASNPKDTEMEGRFKNAVEGILLGTFTELGVASVKKLSDTFVEGVKTYRARRVLKSVQEDTEALTKELEAQGIDIPEEGAEIPEEVAKKIDEAKAKVKKERPSQKGAEEPTFKDVEDETPRVEGEEIDVRDIDTPEKAVEYARKNNEKLEPLIDKLKRGVITDEELNELALAVGDNSDSFKARLMGSVDNAENIVAGGIVAAKRFEQIKPLLEKVAKGTASDAEKAKLLLEQDDILALKMGIESSSSELGRALRAKQVAMKKLGGAGAWRAQLDLLKKGGDPQKIAQQTLDIMNKGNLGKVLNKSMGRKMKDAIYETYINGLLSGLGTHVTNLTSNAAVAVFGVAETGIAEGISRSTNAIRRKSLSAFGDGSVESIAAGETVAKAAGFFNSIGDAFTLAKKTWDTGESMFNNSKAYTRDTERAISAEGFEVGAETVQGKALDLFGKLVGLPTQALEASDEFFKVINYRAEAHALAHRKTQQMLMAGKIGLEEVDATFKNLVDNPPPKLNVEAMSYAKEQTFTKDLAKNEMGLINAKSVENLFRKSSMLKIVAPFLKTPLNIVEHTLKRTPLAPNLRADIAAGGARRDNALARVSFGMMTMGLAGTQAWKGHITGAGPSDRRARIALEQKGWKPYSVKVGDKYYSYERLEPIGSIIGAAADVAEISAALGSDREVEAQELAIKLGAVAGNIATPDILSKNFMDFMDATVHGDQRKAENFIAGIARGAVPFSSFSRSVRRAVDPEQRDRSADKNEDFYILDRAINEIKDTIPGLSTSLPPKRNIWGEAKTYHSFADEDNGPFDFQSSQSDPVSKEIARLNDIHSDSNFLKVDMPEKYMRKTLGGESVSVKFTPEEYDRYVQLAAGIELENAPYDGMTLRDALNEQVMNDYPALDGAPKNDETKILVIKDIIRSYRGAAREQLLQESDDMQFRFEEGFTKRSRQLSGNGFGGSL